MRAKVLRNKPLVMGGTVVIVLVLCAVFAPLLAPASPFEQNLGERLAGPGSPGHLLGTDQFGRDLLSRLIYGTRISLEASVAAVALGSVIGLTLGMLAGYFGGWTDLVVGRLFDVLLSFPTILLALIIVAVLGPALTNLIIAIGLTTAPNYGRVVRASIISVKAREFIQASESFGGSDTYIMRRHVLPNCLPPLIVTTSLGIASAILVESTLSFLGLGVPPPTATWGVIISDGREYLSIAPWISVLGGIGIVFAVLGFSLLGDGLRDAIDPRVSH